MSKHLKKYSSDFKLKVVTKYLSEKLTVAEICSERKSNLEAKTDLAPTASTAEDFDDDIVVISVKPKQKQEESSSDPTTKITKVKNQKLTPEENKEQKRSRDREPSKLRSHADRIKARESSGNSDKGNSL